MKSYKQRITAVKKLRKEADSIRHDERANVFDRVEHCVAIFNDENYRADKGNIDDDKAVEEMESEYLDDLKEVGFGFYDLQALHGHFPARQQWLDVSLFDLWEAFEQYRKDQNKPESKTHRRTRVSLKEYENLVKEKDWAETQAKRMQEEVRDSKDEMARLREENAELRGRIAELERLLDRYSQAAAV